MYSRNSKGPKTDPCGTLQVIVDAKPLIDTNYLQSAEFYSNHLFADLQIP